MSAISKYDIQELARLSALSITEEQAEVLRNQITVILGYVELLDEVDTGDLQPTYQVNGLENVTRDDEIIDYGVSQADLLQNAPAQKDGLIEVPRVLH